MSDGKHINFNANQVDLDRIEILKKHISETLANSFVSYTAVLKTALSMACKQIEQQQKQSQKSERPF